MFQLVSTLLYTIIRSSAFFQPEHAGTAFKHLFSRQTALCNSVFLSWNVPEWRSGSTLSRKKALIRSDKFFEEIIADKSFGVLLP